MPYWKVWKMHIFADCPSCEDVASSQRHWGSKTSQKTKITKRRTKSSCCAAYWPSKTFISLQLFVGKKRARLQPSWTWLTLPVPEENTCAASSELCNWGPQHRCYQSLWHRSQPEHMGQVSGSVNKRVWSPIVSVPWQPPPPHTHTFVSTDKAIVILIFFFSEVGPFHYHPLISCVRRGACIGCFWQQILVLSWEAVIIIPTVPEHTGTTVDTQYWAAPGVWTKLRKEKRLHLSIYPQHEPECFISQARTPQGFICFKR